MWRLAVSLMSIRPQKGELFEPILKACGLGPEKLFIVPGNHDIDRTKFDLLPAQLSKPLDSDIQAKEWLFDSEKEKGQELKPDSRHSQALLVDTLTRRIRVMPIFARMKSAVKRLLCLVLILLGCVGAKKTQKDEINDKGVTGCGLNLTSNEIMGKISESDITIAVLHHPFYWLADFEMQPN